MKQVNLKTNLTRNELMPKAENMLVCYKRDVEILEGYGFAPETEELFASLIADVRKSPFDVFVKSRKEGVNAQKIVIVAEIKDLTSKVRIILKRDNLLVDSGLVGILNAITSSGLRIGTLKDKVSQLIDKLESNTNSVPADYLTKFKGLVADFSSLDALNVNLYQSRKCQTEQRVIATNKLTDLMVQIGEAGRHYWSTRNAAFYTDYLVYKPKRKKSVSDSLPEIMEKAA